MAWIYEQLTGRMIGPTGLVATGYSGAGDGKNNPSMQDVKDVGPIPEGFYSINAPINSPTHGPFAMPLTPDLANLMYGRSAFLIHGDSVDHPGAASEGCIIMPRTAREAIWNSTDHRLQVVRELPTTT